MTPKFFIICGPARAGKTTLARLVGEKSGTVKGYGFEGLFPAYLSRLSWKLGLRPHALFEEYLRRPRFIDRERSQTIKPEDVIASAAISAASERKTFLEKIEHTLAADAGRDFCLADLHAELYHRQLSRGLKNAHLLIVLRDPRECVCAALYWRSYPAAAAQRKNAFYTSLFKWLMSAELARIIARENPGFSSVIGRNSDLGFLGLDKPLLENPAHYDISAGGAFLTPDGEYRALLSPGEISIIENLCAQHMALHGWRTQDAFPLSFLEIVILKGILLCQNFLLRLHPPLALDFIKLIFSPLAFLKECRIRVLQLAKDVRGMA